MKIHFVKAGETLYEISQKYGVTVEAIMAANTSVTDPNTIIAGMKLVIPMKQQVHMPINSTAEPTSILSPLNLNPPPIPVYPELAMTQPIADINPHLTTPIAPISTAQPTPIAPTGIGDQEFSYPGQTMPPFAAIPMPAQEVTAPMPSSMLTSMLPSMPSTMPTPMPSAMPSTLPTPMQAPVSVPTAPVWNTQSGYTAYNTPYHMTNYSTPQALSHAPVHNAGVNSSYLGMPYAASSNYQPYPTSMMQYPSHANYEYYNTYSTLQNNANAEWSSHNPQPHGQYNQPIATQDIVQPQQTKEQVDLEQSPVQQDKKKNRTSSSKERVAVKAKKNTLHDQVLRLHQTRNKANQR